MATLQKNGILKYLNPIALVSLVWSFLKNAPAVIWERALAFVLRKLCGEGGRDESGFAINADSRGNIKINISKEVLASSDVEISHGGLRIHIKRADATLRTPSANPRTEDEAPKKPEN